MPSTPIVIQIEGFVAFTIAILLLFVGKAITQRSSLLRQYSIPEPVIGGFVCAATVAVLYYGFGRQVMFDLEARDALLLYFFAGIGLRADIATLIKGGRPLFVLLILASSFIVLQNLLGMGVAGAFGMDPKAGLLSGSISLTGGVGTTLAWAPTFVEELGIANAMELGVASNTVGLIAACVIGGPIARYLMQRHKIQPSGDADLDIGVRHDADHTTTLSYYGVLWAWLWLNVCLILGYSLNESLEEAGVKLPMFVSCLIAGIVVGNLGRWLGRNRERRWEAEGQQGLALISDICLGMFLTMALMGLQLWELEGLLAYLSVAMGLQITLSILFTLFLVYRLMGRDYDAVVVSAGFGGITLGSTATAIVNMTAVTQQYGASHQAFIIVPLVCGFFIDIVNALVIGFFVGL
ncbi:sodium/glutamate symporter [Ferrimonas balearica]|uniref:sodium/glutamate symporter n=1 Tax=Ferrimonas balearica TaxID=44012 RepID=UPI001C9915FE|nr:sodium/glutamate symporter [Ferrimonas balearica]MBY5921712.1 sodium/glutamate symporter [Ferrimonas balearica]MBY5994948.1 sodium/glutamate symporter [Ferrimonas balearica]